MKIILALVLCFFVAIAHAVPVVSVVVNRTTGTAPLAIHFDGTGTTDSIATLEPLRQYGCYWNYGDPGSGTWATTGKSKNTDGAVPLAAHVYETAGTYNWYVWCYDGLGGEDSANGTITVTDPDTTYSGTDTICYSTNTDHTGCPAGATQVSNTVSFPTWVDNKRYLFHRGQDFSSIGSLGTGRISGTQYGAYGSGAKPILGAFNLQDAIGSYTDTPGAWADNMVVQDLQIKDDLRLAITGTEVLFFRNTMLKGVEAEAEIHIGASWQFYNDLGTYSSSLIYPKNIFVVENIHRVNLSKAFGRGQMVWLGNELGDAWEHNLRIWSLYKGIVGHNDMDGMVNSPRAGRSNLKLQAEGQDVITDIDSIISSEFNPESKWIHVHDNLMNDPADYGIFSGASLQAENASSSNGGASPPPQCVRDAVLENNTFYEGSFGSAGAGLFGGTNLTQRSFTLVPAAYGSIGTADDEGCVATGPYYVFGTADGSVPADGANGFPGAAAKRSIEFGSGIKVGGTGLRFNE